MIKQQLSTILNETITSEIIPMPSHALCLCEKATEDRQAILLLFHSYPLYIGRLEMHKFRITTIRHILQITHSAGRKLMNTRIFLVRQGICEIPYIYQIEE